MRVWRQRAAWRAQWLAPLGVCLYLLTFALPLEVDLALPLLAGCGLLAALRAAGFAGAGPRGIWMPIAGVIAVQLLASAASVAPARSLALSAALVPALAIYLLIAGCFPRPDWVRWVLSAQVLAGLGLSLGALGLLWRMDWRVPPGFQNWTAPLNSPAIVVPNDLAYLALLAPFAVTLIRDGGSRWRRALAAAFLLAVTLLAALAQSRQVAGLLLLMLLAMALLLRPRLALPAAAAVAAALLWVDGLRGFPLAGRFALLWTSGEAGLWDARLPIWSQAWRVFLAHPWLGQGPHTFVYTSADGIQLNWAHNLYLETLAEQGIAGFAALSWLLASLAGHAFRNFRNEPGPERALAAALLSVLAGIVAGGLIEFSFVRLWLNILLFTVAGLLAMPRGCGEAQGR